MMNNFKLATCFLDASEARLFLLGKPGAIFYFWKFQSAYYLFFCVSCGSGSFLYNF